MAIAGGKGGRVWRKQAAGVMIGALLATGSVSGIASAEDPPPVPSGEIDGAVVAVGAPPVPSPDVVVEVGEPPVPGVLAESVIAPPLVVTTASDEPDVPPEPATASPAIRRLRAFAAIHFR